jgi:hypothetical protein
MPRPGAYALRATGLRTSVVDRPGPRLARTGLDGALAELDRRGTPTAVPGEAAADGFTWDAHDRDDPSWMPQGVASLRSGQVLLVSWYAKRRRLRTPGSRVTVVDRSDPEQPRYGHVRLVSARRPLGLLRLGRVPVHAGGIAVLGDLLYVADTLAGVRMFRLSDLARVRRRSLVQLLRGQPAGELVLPQVMCLRVPLLAGPGRLRWSFLSVGEVDGQLSLVAGEYGRKGSTPRLVRFALDPANGLPAFGPDGRCAPLEVHERQPVRMQGVAVHGSTWVLSASAGEHTPGDLHVGAPGAFRRHRGVLPPGPEDLDWARPGEQLWGLSEHPGRRWVFSVDVTRWT